MKNKIYQLKNAKRKILIKILISTIFTLLSLIESFRIKIEKSTHKTDRIQSNII